MDSKARQRAVWAIAACCAALAGCRQIPIVGHIATHTTFHGRTDVAAQVDATLRGPIDIRVPTVTDPGPLAAVPVRAGGAGPGSPRVAIVDVDGLILNQNLTGLYSTGENPVAAFREKLEAAAADPLVRAVVVRINSPGGSVTACDIAAEELRRFRAGTRKPAVACLMDLGTSGAYYVAVGCDRIVAHPTTVTGGIGARLNHYNLADAMAQLNIVSETIKSGALVDMGTVTGPLPAEAERLLQELTDGLGARFRDRVASQRPQIEAADWNEISDGRVVPAPRALALHLVDRIGYLEDAIAEAERLCGAPGSAVVLFQRRGVPAHSIYAITPNTPIQRDLIPFSYPGLDRAKVPTFLYLWSPDPTLLSQVGH